MPTSPSLECDVVMKGGITSGVVYPKALLRLKDRYRFRNVGGASAGGIAAGVAAAAEFGRNKGGFERVDELPREMADHLGDLFQPTPSLKSLHRVFVALTTKNPGKIIVAIVTGYWPWLLVAAIIGIASAWLAITWGQAGIGLGIVLGVIAWLLSKIVLLLSAVLFDVFVKLPANDFGLCSGPTQPGATFDGLSNWIARVVEEAAGRLVTAQAPLDGRTPLTFDELRVAGIALKMMTTNLTLGLGHVLPILDDKNYFWHDEDMRRVMPGWIVDYLAKVCGDPHPVSGLRPFPTPDRLPVALGIRMSLSFPGLMSAVRLYRIDFGEKLPEGQPPNPMPVLFSDGGISSNFPVHFFDTLFPGRPTFGISLDPLDTSRPERKVYLPMDAARGRWFPRANAVAGLLSFGMAILNTAKDWQDRRLGALSGYRERIVHIFLEPKEGGLNLAMESVTIDALSAYGDRAGALMVGQPVQDADIAAFDFTDHQWRRFLVAYYQIEQLLEAMRDKWGDPADSGSFAASIRSQLADPPSYKASTPEWRQEIWDRINRLMASSKVIFEPPMRDPQDGRIPSHKARMQIVPEA
jgi:hypothetical protein